MIGLFGATGFIGRNLVDHLTADGTVFRTFSRRPVPEYDGDAVLMDFEDPASYLAGLDGLTSAVLLVSASVPGTYATDLPGEIERNVLPYARFFKAIEGTAIRRIVYLSSGGTVYGLPQTELIEESHPRRPVSPYGCAKLMIENMIETVSASGPRTYAILRPSNPVGPYQTAGKGQGLVARAVRACLTGETMEIWGDGSVVRDYFDVRHLCRAVTALLAGDFPKSGVFNVGSGVGMSVNDVLALTERSTRRTIDRRYIRPRTFDVPRNVVSSEALRRTTGVFVEPLGTSTVEALAEQLRR